jgi:hypothetical protein
VPNPAIATTAHAIQTILVVELEARVSPVKCRESCVSSRRARYSTVAGASFETSEQRANDMPHFASTIALIGIVVIVASLLSGRSSGAGSAGTGVPAARRGAGSRGTRLLDIGFESPELHALATLGLTLVLFSDAVTLDIRELRSRGHLLIRILGPGTLVPAALIAVAAYFLLHLPLAAAALLGRRSPPPTRCCCVRCCARRRCRRGCARRCGWRPG